jgi:hypothetical protein
MADTPVSPDPRVIPDRGAPPSTPGWVKAFGIIALVLAILVGILLLSGEHGPGRHMQPASTTAEHTPMQHGG